VRSYVDSMVGTDSHFGVRAQAMFIGRLDSAWVNVPLIPSTIRAPETERARLLPVMVSCLVS